MTKTEAKILGSQLGWEISSVAEFDDHVDRAGYQLALDNQTAEWVVIDKDHNELARCEQKES